MGDVVVDGGNIGGVAKREPDLGINTGAALDVCCMLVSSIDLEKNDFIGISELGPCGKLSRLPDTTVNGCPFPTIRTGMERLILRPILN